MCVCVCVYIDVFLTQPFIVAFDEKERKKTDARRCCLNSRLFFFSLALLFYSCCWRCSCYWDKASCLCCSSRFSHHFIQARKETKVIKARGTTCFSVDTSIKQSCCFFFFFFKLKKKKSGTIADTPQKG